jgi:hypothetical protein
VMEWFNEKAGHHLDNRIKSRSKRTITQSSSWNPACRSIPTHSK